MRYANPIRMRRMWFSALSIALPFLSLSPLAAAKDAASCGPGVELHLSSPESSQGSLLLATLKSAKPLDNVTADWDGRTIPFWGETGNDAVQSGLVGVDLEKPPGAYELKVTVQMAAGDKVACSMTLSVNAGHFATEKLQVARQFVEPTPEQIRRADEEGKRLREIFDRITPERLWDGAFRMPLDAATSGTNFGKRRVLNGQPRSPHTGMDFPAMTGTPVHAAQRGRVALARNLFFSGNTVVVDHGLGIYTFYGHLSEIAVKEGDSVEAGAVLGKVGATGRATGPHLHWGLTVQRARVNPLQIVKLLQGD